MTHLNSQRASTQCVIHLSPAHTGERPDCHSRASESLIQLIWYQQVRLEPQLNPFWGAHE